MFFFFPFGGGGGFFIIILLLLLGRVLRNLRNGGSDNDSYRNYQNNSNNYYRYNFGANGNTKPAADFYKVLGLTSSATEAEIKKAYRKLIMEYHPDTVASKQNVTKEYQEYTTRKFREVQEAYEHICKERGIK